MVREFWGPFFCPAYSQIWISQELLQVLIVKWGQFQAHYILGLNKCLQYRKAEVRDRRVLFAVIYRMLADNAEKGGSLVGAMFWNGAHNDSTDQDGVSKLDMQACILPSSICKKRACEKHGNAILFVSRQTKTRWTTLHLLTDKMDNAPLLYWKRLRSICKDDSWFAWRLCLWCDAANWGLYAGAAVQI